MFSCFLYYLTCQNMIIMLEVNRNMKVFHLGQNSLQQQPTMVKLWRIALSSVNM